MLLDFCIQFRCNEQWGTGILVKLDDLERDCIITAAHCLEEYSELKNIEIIGVNYKIIQVLKGNKDMFDVGLIFIEKQPDITFKPYYINDVECLAMEQIEIMGYPGIKVDRAIRYENLKFVYAGNHQDIIRMKLIDNIESLYCEIKPLIDGMSGGPAYIEKAGNIYIVGILSRSTHDDFEFREVDIISFKSIIDYLGKKGIKVHAEERESIIADIIERIDPGYEEWKKLSGFKDRNYKQKISDVCNEKLNRKLSRFSRNIADANTEIAVLSARQRGALLYRIFRGANNVQAELVDEGLEKLTMDDIAFWLNRYAEEAQKVIRIKSTDYDYPLQNNDLIKNIVDKLIDECYLSFDEEGLIE